VSHSAAQRRDALPQTGEDTKSAAVEVPYVNSSSRGGFPEADLGEST
jgi:hypothetical protein